jgi:predicted glycoside hydrolase/deacetylase ChbG (UPF0249 family)
LKSNPALKKLGFSDKDKVVIIHADDIGMCQASVTAFIDLWESGNISSGATMVPCPWFPNVAQYARKNNLVDLGVHVTLTSEWDTYRWGPISTRDPASGLIDSEGYFFPSSEEVQKNGTTKAVRMEIQAQIERAVSAGIQPSHLDTHMGAVASMEFIPSYLQLAIEFRLPPMIMRMDKQGWIDFGIDEGTAELAANMINQLEDLGLPLPDRIATLELDKFNKPDDRVEYAKQVINSLGPGITHFIIHPSKDTPELRAITPDWAYRVADYEALRDADLQKHIKEIGVQVIGYQPLKDLIHAE